MSGNDSLRCTFSAYYTAKCPPIRRNVPGSTTGVVGGDAGVQRTPTFFDRGDASSTPPLFWTEIRAKVSPPLQLVTY